MKNFNKKILISYIMIFGVILFSSIIIYFRYQELNSQISYLSKQYSNTKKDLKEANKKMQQLVLDSSAEITKLKMQTSFMDNNVVLINSDSAKIYHKYNCTDYNKNGSFYAFNVNNAIKQGYLPCSICNAPVPKNKATERTYTVYITNTGSKYHTSNCKYLSKSKISISLKNAVSQGYSPCSVCDP